ncbi:MAG: carotenoid oxygenase family protein [Acidobacteria bacterium]|nr:carotenoid oxygenase family protein [Acidobacteriota bacterium]
MIRPMLTSTQAEEAAPAPLLERCFLFDAIEADYQITQIEGQVPPWLLGYYYINGPARFERAGFRYRHWLDGDGMVCRLRFRPGRVDFASRFVGTRKLREENAAGRPLYRTFGTAFRGDRLRREIMLEPPLNVSVYPFAGTLLTFSEQSLPMELDPETLATRGEYDFHGSLNEISPFAAHPKFDPATGHMVNFGISFSPHQPMLHLYEFDPVGRQLRRRRYPLQLQHSNHDFGLTRNYAVFFLSPLVMDFNKFWNERVSVMESLSWQPERGSRFLILPRKSGGAAAFEVPAGCGKCLHLINCFESNGCLTADLLELEAPVYPEYETIPDLFSNISPCRPVRYRIDLETQALVERTVMEYDRGPDFPSFDKSLLCQAYNDFWMLGISATGRPGRKFFDQLAHGDWRRGEVSDVFQTEPGEYLAGEPIFVADPGAPQEGVILVEQIDARSDTARFLLFKATHVSHGPIARIPLRHKIHPGFHASFALSP